jgi:glucosamine-6-phosphate deaminase
MKILITENYNSMSEKAADIIINQIASKQTSVICFATGTTPLKTYKLLINAYKKKKVDFSKVVSFNLDEYYPIQKKDKNSYFYYMHKNLFDHINLSEKNINILNGDCKDPKLECLNHAKKIEKHPFDLVILGIGSNGHIGFNEPGTPFDKEIGIIDLSDSTIKDNARFFSSSSKVPRQALSLGIKTIMSGKKILVIASGKKKANAVKNMIKGNITEKCPASILQKHKNCMVILDKDAASQLT